MDDIVIDTNIVVWYFTGPKISSVSAQTAIVKAQESGGLIYVPSITIVELTYLLEKNRIPVDVIDTLREALDDESTSFRLAELTRGVADDVQRIDSFHSRRYARPDHCGHCITSRSAANNKRWQYPEADLR